jgi:hypothetical protein
MGCSPDWPLPPTSPFDNIWRGESKSLSGPSSFGGPSQASGWPDPLQHRCRVENARSLLTALHSIPIAASHASANIERPQSRRKIRFRVLQVTILMTRNEVSPGQACSLFCLTAPPRTALPCISSVAPEFGWTGFHTTLINYLSGLTPPPPPNSMK